MEIDYTYTLVAPEKELNHPSTTALNPVDQTNPRFYTQLILCFPISSPTAAQSVCSALRSSLARTISDIPILSGSLEPEMKIRTSGRLSIVCSETSGVPFHIRGLGCHSAISYADIMQEGYPIKDFDADRLTPVDAVAYDSSPAVMIVQANFVAGGLLLAICVHHAAMDASGISAVLQIWANHSRTMAHNTLSQTTISSDALDRQALMPLDNRQAEPGDYPQYKFLNSYPNPTVSPPPETQLPFPLMTSKIFHFTLDQLIELKAEASQMVPVGHWVSTHDVLCAVLWKSIAEARTKQQDRDDMATSTLSFQVDGRRRINPPLPTDYVGNANIYTSVTRPLTSLPRADMGAIALEVRHAIQRLTNDRIRDIVELLGSAQVATDVHAGGKHFLGEDLAITSWAALPLNGLDWGPTVGTVERVRVPYGTFDGLCIVLPRLEDGSLEVVVGLVSLHMERLVEILGRLGIHSA